jgi:hypothetical protein
MGAVTTGRFGQLIGVLVLASFFLWIFSTTLEAIDIILVVVVFLGLSVWTKLDRGHKTIAGDTPRLP